MKNVLTNLNSHKLYSWIDENEDLARSSTALELARISEGELGFTVTESNADTARRESGIVMRPVVVRDEDTTTNDIKALATALGDLYNYSGYVCPQQIDEIRKR